MSKQSYKIATWNVNSLKVRLSHVLDWIETHKPDVLGLQETKLIDENFPIDAFKEINYFAQFSGQKTYNGVALISREAGSDCVTDIKGLEDPQRRIIAATFENIRVLNVYVPNGQDVESDKYQYKLQWLKHVINYVKSQLATHDKFVIMGDFNIAPEAIDVYDPALFEGKVLCSDKERAAFKALLDLGLADTFRLFSQDDRCYSWWDYRMLAFRRKRGLRIDHILASQALSEHCVSCTIDKAPRKLERPSDHAPVMAEFVV